MYYYKTSILASLVAGGLTFVSAQVGGSNPITAPESGQVLTAGSPFVIRWEPTTDGTVSLYLLGGSSPSTLGNIGAIAENIDNTGSRTWIPSASPGASVYGIQITAADGTFHYSFPFSISG